MRSAEHFGMANYMTAIEEADNLGLDGAVDLLENILEEEEYSDKRLAVTLKEDLKLVPDEELED